MAAISPTAYEVGLQAWLQSVVSPTVFANQGGARPSDSDFATLRTVSPAPVGTPANELSDTEVAGAFKGARRFEYTGRAEVNLFGPAHRANYEAIVASRWSLATKRLLADHPVAITGIGPGNDLTGLAGTDYEGRTQFELTFRYSDDVQYSGQSIETAAGTTTFPESD